MADAGVIRAQAVMDPSMYIAGMNQMAAATRSFQTGMSSMSFAGFNRSMIATTTILYGLNRIMGSMSKGMEEYAQVLAKIGSVADLTAASVESLAESMKKLSVDSGTKRSDMMKGMYVALQSRFDSPAEMRSMASAGAILSRASGKEIDVKKSTDLLAVVRQGLGLGQGSVDSRRVTDILLKGRDVGRWELDQMAAALGIPMTIYGNEFSSKIGGEETLRQLIAIMSTATLVGLKPNVAATGTRRLVERTVQLSKSGKLGDPLRRGLRGIGFGGENPILDALGQGPMAFLNNLNQLTGGTSSGLIRYGYGSRDLRVLTSALRENGSLLNRTYQGLDYGQIAGTTDKYYGEQKQTYGYTRDRLRSEWEITSQQFMQASLPLIGAFTSALEGINKVAQALPDSVKSLVMLVGALGMFRVALRLFGFRGPLFETMLGMKGGAAVGGALSGMARLDPSTAVAGKAGSVVPPMMPLTGKPFPVNPNASADRLARRMSKAKARGYSYAAGFGKPNSGFISPNALIGAPLAGMGSPMSIAGARNLGEGALRFPIVGDKTPLGTAWASNPHLLPLNSTQYYVQSLRQANLDAQRASINRQFFAPSGKPWIRGYGGQQPPSLDRMLQLSTMGAFSTRYSGIAVPSLTGTLSGKELAPEYRFSKYGPTTAQRIRWEAYKRGESIGLDPRQPNYGMYGSLSPAAAAYRNRPVPRGPMNVREWNRFNRAWPIGHRVPMSPAAPLNYGADHADDVRMQLMVSPGRAVTPVSGRFAKWFGRFGRDAASVGNAVGMGVASTAGMYAGASIGRKLEGEEGGGFLPSALGMGAAYGSMRLWEKGASYLASETGKAVLKKGAQWAMRNAARLPGLGVGLAATQMLLGDVFGERPETHDEFQALTKKGVFRKPSMAKDVMEYLAASGQWFGDFGANKVRAVGGLQEETAGVERLGRLLLPYAGLHKWWGRMTGNVVEDNAKYADLSEYLWNAVGSDTRRMMGANKVTDINALLKNKRFGEIYTKQYGAEEWTKLIGGELDSSPESAFGKITDALKQWTPELLKAAEATRAAADAQRELNWYSDPVNASEMTRTRMMLGNQYSIYKAAEYDMPQPNWNDREYAGGKTYREMYDEELARLDAKTGMFSGKLQSDMLFLAQHPELMMERQNDVDRWNQEAIKSRSGKMVSPTTTLVNVPHQGGWVPIKGTSFTGGAGLPNLSGYGASQDAQSAYEDLADAVGKNARLMAFAKIMPDLATMGQDKLESLLTELTGRTNDPFFKRDAANMGALRVRDYTSVKEISPETQYAQATQYGTAEAYNALLQRDNPQVKMQFDVEKIAGYMERLAAPEADVAEEEYKAVVQKASAFFDAVDVKHKEMMDALSKIDGSIGEL